MADAKVLSLKQLLQKTYEFLVGLPPRILESFGALTRNFIMIIWGQSGHGKTNLLIEILKALMPHGTVLYISLEEGTEATMQMTAIRHLNDEHLGRILFADSSMNYDELVKRLKRKKSPQFIIIDSIQYWDCDYQKYKALKRMFNKKTFIFISHESGKLPDGKTADKIRYDATIKVRVEGFVAFVKSRLGGNKPYCIWEEGARKYYGEAEYNKIFEIKKEKKRKNKNETVQNKEEVIKNETVTNEANNINGVGV